MAPTAVTEGPSFENEQIAPVLRKRRTPEEVGVVGVKLQPPGPQSNQDEQQQQQQQLLNRSVSKSKLAGVKLPQQDESTILDEEITVKAAEGNGKWLFKRPATPVNWIFLGVLTLLAYATRLYRISRPNFVLWDEAHFGKFGSYYLRRMFYFDVHPPLGKMLVALGGWLAKVDGSFEFPSGQAYPEGFNYTGMRMFVAAFGTLAVPFTYLLALQLGLSRNAAYLCGLMALLDNGLIVITRLILLDSFLLCFTSLTALCYAWFRNQADRPFGGWWWTSLVATGLAIGCVSSVKWVGFFVTALVGLNTVDELWAMLGEPKRYSKKLFARHFLARAVGLILVPFAVYAACFHVHFTILNRTGPGDSNMSSLFQAGLQGNKLHESPLQVIFGSQVTLKSNSYGGGLLHSHVQAYPVGSKQQQVTTYHHKDQNNDWVFVRSYEDAKGAEADAAAPIPARIKDGEVVRLRHVSTGKFLHSHPIAAPLSAGEWEVSAYGGDSYEDPNDLWVVEIINDLSGSNKQLLQSLSTQFRLKHRDLGCYLKARNKALPEWGFRQGEVTCDRTGDASKSKSLIWNIESNAHEKLPAGDSSQYKSRFWDNFRDCNVGMYLTNNALTPDPELEPSILTSNARDWLFMRRGIRMSGWDDDRLKFYMLGNPMVWLGGTVAILGLLGYLVFIQLAMQRKVWSLVPTDYPALKYQLKLVLGGWALHYLPFFLMGRVLYLHHYYPALLFAILTIGLVYDRVVVVGGLKGKEAASLWVALAVLVLAVFAYFSPMAYGIEGSSKAFLGRRWIRSWNL